MENNIKTLMCTVFNITKDSINDDSSIDNISAWDSLNHMKFITALEGEFDVEFDEEELLAMVSVKKIISSLSSKLKLT